ncbi:coiled-coil domain-containing protein [Azotobacter salinestris]|uniref:hypothetical protein n=1 Tax=Azotobacter salinestris TaxID=69964 RepID=UPI0012668936|nr:hypothetical protein [Azotobacter salinestris]
MDTAHPTEIRPMPTPAQTTRLLQGLFPPRAAIIVGASRSHRHLLEWPGVRPEHVLLVDAHPEALANTRQKIATTSAWQMRHAVLADSKRQARFFCASNPGEDGLVPPQKLAELWPNLRATDEWTCTTQTLQDVLADPEQAELVEASDIWLVVNCLPALRILQGAGPLLEHCKVLWLRVLLEPLEDGEPGSTLEEAERYLADRHFRRIHCIEENHPRIGQAIFLRDDSTLHEREIARLQATCDSLETRRSDLFIECDALRQEQIRLAAEHQAQLEAFTKEKAELLAARDALLQEKAALTKARDEQAKLANERQARIEALTQESTALTATHDKMVGERDQQTRLAAERQAQLEALAKEKAELLAARDALLQEKAALTRARDEQAKLTSERQARIEALTQESTDLTATRDKMVGERDQQTRLAAERQAQLEALAKEKAELLAARDALVQEKAVLTRARDSQTQLIAERDERVHQLEADLQKSLTCLQLMQDELVKGEAQIELIKDLLLREPGLRACYTTL